MVAVPCTSGSYGPGTCSWLQPWLPSRFQNNPKEPGSTPALGVAFMVTLPVGLDTQPVADDVK